MAVLNPDDPTVVALCEDQKPPVVKFADECATPELNYGPIVNLYASQEPAAADTGLTATEIATRMALPVTDPAKMVRMIVEIGSANTTTGEVERYNGRDIPKPGTLSLGVTIKETTDENVEFARLTQQSGYNGHYWGVDKGNKMWGVKNGLFGKRSTLKLRVNIPTDENALQTITGDISTVGFFDTKRIESPVPVLFG